MSKDFMSYRRECFGIIRDLLAHKPMEKQLYLLRAKAAYTSNELSRVMVDVRHSI